MLERYASNRRSVVRSVSVCGLGVAGTQRQGSAHGRLVLSGGAQVDKQHDQGWQTVAKKGSGAC